MENLVRRARFVLGAASAKAFPDWDLPEVAFAGRSNVGKSSALKVLTGGKTKVRVSKNPGRTTEINFFELGLTDDRTLSFVDLPGYGYASVPRAMREHWGTLVRGYFENRKRLALTILLCDLRRGPESEEEGLVAWLEELDIPWLLLLTKADKISKSQRKPMAWKAAKALDLTGSSPILFSAKDGFGIEQLWRKILQASFG